MYSEAISEGVLRGINSVLRLLTLDHQELTLDDQELPLELTLDHSEGILSIYGCLSFGGFH
jgi:hypothetical protein